MTVELSNKAGFYSSANADYIQLPAISKSSVPKPASVSTISLATLSPTLYRPYRMTTSIPSTRYLFWIYDKKLSSNLGHLITSSFPDY